jgi:hypothetical protein
MEALVMIGRSVFTLLAAAAISVPAAVAPALVTPAAAQLDIRIGIAPPAPRYEVVPAPRSGYVWAPGVWTWNGGQYVWRAGHWVDARPGYRYVPERWEPYWADGRQHWRFVASRWDKDGDGIPNRYDRYDNRYAWGDRDRDGVPNAWDRYDNRRAYYHDRDRDGAPNWRDRYDNNPYRY